MAIGTRNHVSLLTTRQPDLWMESLQEIGHYDTYHLPAYHKLAEIQGEGEALMLVYRDGPHVIAFPMLVRSIPLPSALNAAQGMKDTTSAYGYGGPVSNGPVPADVQERFAATVQDFYRQQGIICAFSRTHPLIGNEYLLSGWGDLSEVGAVVSIDLTQTPEEQWHDYRRNHRKGIGQLQARGFVCDEVGIEGLDDFIHIYYESMDRNQAESYYYFDRAHFEYLLTEMSDVTHLFLCRRGDVPVSTCIMFACNGFIQGHLGGTLTWCLSLAPMKMTLDSIRRWAIGRDYHTYNLGGGVGGARDSLFMFKQGFSKREHEVSVWRYIADRRAYQELSVEVRRYYGKKPETDYFPYYRNPAFRAFPTAGSAAGNVVSE